MDKKKREWQDTDYVLGYFGKNRHQARKKYYAYIEEGVNQGRRYDLTGGGLIRSSGGWSELKEARHKGIHVKSDERILGDSEFVARILSESSEKFERHYELRRKGYDLIKIADRAAGVCGIEAKEIFSGGKQKGKVKARSLFCYWASRELGVTLSELSRRLGISVPGVCYPVERGEIIARENNYQLIEEES